MDILWKEASVCGVKHSLAMREASDDLSKKRELEKALAIACGHSTNVRSISSGNFRLNPR